MPKPVIMKHRLTILLLLFAVGSPVLAQNKISVGVSTLCMLTNPFQTTIGIPEKKIITRPLSGIDLKFSGTHLNKRMNISYIVFNSDYVLTQMKGLQISDYDESNKGKFYRISTQFGIEKPLGHKKLKPYPFADIIFCYTHFNGILVQEDGWTLEETTTSYDHGSFGTGINTGVGVSCNIFPGSAFHAKQAVIS